MALIIILNALLCGGVIVMVVAPLVWSILTQHRDHPEVAFEAQDRPTRSVRPARPTSRRSKAPRYRPAIWPT